MHDTNPLVSDSSPGCIGKVNVGLLGYGCVCLKKSGGAEASPVSHPLGFLHAGACFLPFVHMPDGEFAPFDAVQFFDGAIHLLKQKDGFILMTGEVWAHHVSGVSARDLFELFQGLRSVLGID